MQSDQALRYLLLKHLWRLRALADGRLHAEVARSLTVEKVTGLYVVSWTHGGLRKRVELPAERFSFYKRGDLQGPKAGAPLEAGAPDNEQAAWQLASDILGVGSQAPGPPRRAVALYNDVWRWPTLFVIVAVACWVTSRSVVPFVVAGTAFVETRMRTSWLYLPLVAALVAGRYRTSAVLVGGALAGLTYLGVTARRDPLQIAGYLLLAYLGWHFGLNSGALPGVWTCLVICLLATYAWITFWLSFEGQRFLMLLTPPLVVTLVFDGHVDEALAYLSICLAYSVWLTIPIAMRQSLHV